MLQLAAYGEYHSSHPIALSIKEAYGKTIDASCLEHYEEVAGNGIQVTIHGEKVLLGNEKLMRTHGISTVPCPTQMCIRDRYCIGIDHRHHHARQGERNYAF